MKLLVITQAVDVNHPVLGFFHRWLQALATPADQLLVIALQVGEHHLPSKVRVLSLGKEAAPGRLKYLWRFCRYLWRERRNYDRVFVHMNQEYILLAGWWWWLTGKKVFMWRNHPAGGWLTDLAALFCHKVFCTSKYSYTARYKKAVLMPVGIDTELFKPSPAVIRQPHSILFLGRIAPVKRPHILLEALGRLRERGVDFTASIYGDPLPTDRPYYEALLKRVQAAGLTGQVRFYPGVANTLTPPIYQRHQIFVNLSPSGMYDKTIFEAMACGCFVLTSNDNLRADLSAEHLVGENNVVDLTSKLITQLAVDKRDTDQEFFVYVESKHSLTRLINRLEQEMS